MSEALKLADELWTLQEFHVPGAVAPYIRSAAEMLRTQAAEIERLRALTWAPPCHNGNSAEHWNKLAVDRYQENCKLEAELESLRAERDALKADASFAIGKLCLMFDEYENGLACYEGTEEDAGYVGNAVQLDGKDFSDIADFLNRVMPIAAIAAAKEQVK